MEITVETNYDLAAMKALSRGLRKTVRKKRSRRSHIFGWIVVFFGLLLLLSASKINARFVITALSVAMIVLAFVFEDTINAKIAMQRGIPGLHSAVTVFDEAGYRSKTEVGESSFYYTSIHTLAETQDYFLLIIGFNHGQVYAKRGITTGSEDGFRQLLEENTGKTFIRV